jgi:hypothetical protein
MRRDRYGGAAPCCRFDQRTGGGLKGAWPPAAAASSFLAYSCPGDVIDLLLGEGLPGLILHLDLAQDLPSAISV